MNRWNLLYNYISDFFRQTAGAIASLELGRLPLLFVGAIALTFVLSNNNATAQLLFQSPASPALDPAFLEPPPPVEQQPIVEPAAPPPAEQPVVEPAAPPPVEQQPESPPPAPDQPAPVPLDQFPAQSESPPPMPEMVSPVAQPESTTGEASSLEPPPLAQPRPERVERLTGRESDEENSRNLILDQAELIDTVVVSTAYVWLCCGIMLFLLIPLVFLFLQIRGRTQIKDEYL
jgi:hypothetical protein